MPDRVSSEGWLVEKVFASRSAISGSHGSKFHALGGATCRWTRWVCQQSSSSRRQANHPENCEWNDSTPLLTICSLGSPAALLLRGVWDTRCTAPGYLFGASHTSTPSLAKICLWLNITFQCSTASYSKDRLRCVQTSYFSWAQLVQYDHMPSNHSGIQVGVLLDGVRSSQHRIYSFVYETPNVRCRIGFSRHFLCSHLKPAAPAVWIRPPTRHPEPINIITVSHIFWQCSVAAPSRWWSTLPLLVAFWVCAAALNYALWCHWLV